MRLYHGSNVLGLDVLKPQLADHDRPYVYMTTIDSVAALYLCNAVEKPYYWFPYGFDETGDVPVYHELYPNAFKEVSEGVSGCIYVVDTNEDQYIPFKNIPCARLGIVPMETPEQIRDALYKEHLERRGSPMNSDELSIFKTYDSFEAERVSLLLEAEGIPSFKRVHGAGQYLSILFGTNTTQCIEIIIPENCEEKALQVLEGAGFIDAPASDMGGDNCERQ